MITDMSKMYNTRNIKFHKELHSRNLGLLTDQDQEKLANVTLLIAGCGVGSLIAISATRLGFRKFVLVDGDRVELSNTSRRWKSL